MRARFEIVRTDADQPWHGRRVVNDRITWTTETMTRQVGVERAILSLLNDLAGGDWELRWNVEGREKVAVNEVGMVHDLVVTYVDERRSA